jgi:3-deoxy-D-manno-octulosonate 8-phosphate phosphatase (KDO 8-P phosphatase)
MQKYTKEELIEKFKDVELLSLDADGTLTDGGMYLDENNVSIRKFYAHDGTGIQMVKKLGVKVAMVTTSISPIMNARAKILGFDDLVTNSHDKGTDILALCKKLNVNPAKTIHMGDDVNEILGFKVVGFPIAVANSAPVVFDYACYTTKKNGGDGAVREICDLILLAKTGKLYGEPYVSLDKFIQ